MSGSENSPAASDKEEEMKEEEKEEVDESLEEEKESRPSPTKSPKKKEESEEEEEESEGDEDEDGEHQGLLDKPVVIEGKRERKKTDRIEFTVTSPKTEALVIPEGKGEKLGDCPLIEHFLSKHKAEDLKPLHRCLFNKVGKVLEIKRNIRKFCGFTFEKDSPEYKKKVDSITKMTMAQLKSIAETVGIERGGSKPELIERLMDFLLNPKASDKALPKKKGRGRTKSGGTDKPTKKRKRKTKEKGETKKASKKTTSEENDDVELSPDSESEDEEKDKTKDESEEEEEVQQPKKKKAKTEAPKKPRKKPEKKEKKEKKVPTPKKKKAAAPPPSDDSDEGSTSDEEPLAKQSKKPPGDEELKEVVRKILDGANLEEITMKTVCKQVYAKYPDFDLTDKKDFIKSTVRNIIQ